MRKKVYPQWFICKKNFSSLSLSIRPKTHFAFRFASPNPTPLKRSEKQPSGKRLRNISPTKNFINTFFFAGRLEYSRGMRMREVTHRRDLVLELCNSVQHLSSSSYDGTKFALRAHSLDAFLDITQLSRHRSILEESESFVEYWATCRADTRTELPVAAGRAS